MASSNSFTDFRASGFAQEWSPFVADTKDLIGMAGALELGAFKTERTRPVHRRQEAGLTGLIARKGGGVHFPAAPLFLLNGVLMAALLVCCCFGLFWGPTGRCDETR